MKAQKTQTPVQDGANDKLRRIAVEQGYVTIDQMNECLPEGVTPEQMDNFFILLGDMKIEVVETHDDGRQKRAAQVATPAAPAKEEESSPLRFDDPVRMYLREMGRVPLLNREGEIAIAKRIEEGELVVRRAVFRAHSSLAELEALAGQLAKGEVRVEDVVQGDLGDWGPNYTGKRESQRILSSIRKVIQLSGEVR